jgi:hypothetical protein
MIDRHDVFVSYARPDDEAGRVARFVDDLQAAYETAVDRPLRIFFDSSSVGLADRWESRIASALRSSEVLLPMVSPAFLRSRWCGREFVEFRSHHGRAGVDGRVLPVRLVGPRDVRLPSRQIRTWKRQVLAYQWLDLHEQRDRVAEYRRGLETIVGRIRDLLEPSVPDDVLAGLRVDPALDVREISYGEGRHGETISGDRLVHVDLIAAVPKEFVAFDGNHQLIPRRLVDAGIVHRDRLVRLPRRFTVRGRRSRGSTVAVFLIAGVAYLQGVDRDRESDHYAVDCVLGRGGIADFVDRDGSPQDWNPLVLGGGLGAVGGILVVELAGSSPVRRSHHCIVVRAGIRYPDDVWLSERTGRPVVFEKDVASGRFLFQSRQPNGTSCDVFAADFDGLRLVNLTWKPQDAYDGFFDEAGREVAEWVGPGTARICSMRGGRRAIRTVEDRAGE